MQNLAEILAQTIRTVENFPSEGISFKDITPILQNPELLCVVADALAAPYKNQGISKVIGIESRGFLFGVMIAERLGAGFIPVRKPNKLPYKTIRQEYVLEYGTDILEMHTDALQAGEKVLIHDDVLATGGTASAVEALVAQLQGEVQGLSFLIELSFLHGKDKLTKPHQALITY